MGGVVDSLCQPHGSSHVRGSRSRLVSNLFLWNRHILSIMQVEMCVWGSHCRGSDLADGPGVRSTPKLGKGSQIFCFWVT